LSRRLHLGQQRRAHIANRMEREGADGTSTILKVWSAPLYTEPVRAPRRRGVPLPEPLPIGASADANGDPEWPGSRFRADGVRGSAHTAYGA
jgi:hypothetical protein